MVEGNVVGMGIGYIGEGGELIIGVIGGGGE
jgi:hypothetical protein